MCKSPGIGYFCSLGKKNRDFLLFAFFLLSGHLYFCGQTSSCFSFASFLYVRKRNLLFTCSAAADADAGQETGIIFPIARET